MLARIRKAQTTSEQDQGFTLIELLVVVVIIGILAVIAIPTFLSQREKAWTRAVESDLRNNGTKMEEHFNETGKYLITTTAPSLRWSTDVQPGTHTSSDTAYCLLVKHAKLSTTRSWVFKSTEGKVQEVGVGGATTC